MVWDVKEHFKVCTNDGIHSRQQISLVERGTTSPFPQGALESSRLTIVCGEKILLLTLFANKQFIIIAKRNVGDS